MPTGTLGRAGRTDGTDEVLDWITLPRQDHVLTPRQVVKVMVPTGYRSEGYAARSATAKAAATTRSQARRATEADMIAATIQGMQTAKNGSVIAAGKVVDRLYPEIARARRRRIAYAASGAVIRDRGVAAAAGDETALGELARRFDEAKVALFELVGAEQFSSLGPAGYPRSFWKV
jgi:hypothetical protein